MSNAVVKTQVISEAVVPKPAAEIWNTLVSFGGTEKFVPEIISAVAVEGRGLGAVRIITLVGGGLIIERLVSIDTENLKMSFEILSTPMPLENYVGTMKVTAIDESRCHVLFDSCYEVAAEQKEEMLSIIKGFQATFLSNVHKG